MTDHVPYLLLIGVRHEERMVNWIERDAFRRGKGLKLGGRSEPSRRGDRRDGSRSRDAASAIKVGDKKIAGDEVNGDSLWRLKLRRGALAIIRTEGAACQRLHGALLRNG